MPINEVASYNHHILALLLDVPFGYWIYFGFYWYGYCYSFTEEWYLLQNYWKYYDRSIQNRNILRSGMYSIATLLY